MLEIVGGQTLGNLPGKSDAFDLRNRKSSTTVTATTNGLPIGGSTGNVLVKNSGTNYDAVWNTLATAGIAAASHTHGNITNAGLLTTAVTLGSTPKFVITDTSTNAIGTYTPTGTASATTYLSGTGVWSTPTNFTGLGSLVTGISSDVGVALPISTSNSGASSTSGAISVITGTTTLTGATTGTVTIKSGDSASSGGNSGAITIQSGAGSGSTGNSGSVTIDAGVKSGSGTVGTISIGGTNATNIYFGAVSSSPTVTRILSIGGALGATSTGAFQTSVSLNNWYAIVSGGTASTSLGGGYSLSSGGTSTITIGAWGSNSGTQTIGIGTTNGTSTTTLNGITNLAGSLNLVAGTTALNPIKFTANSSTPTLAAGVVDFDGNAFFATPKVNNSTAGKGLIPTQQIFIPNAATTIATTSTASATASGAAMGNKFIYLAASTTYEVDAVLYVQASWTGSQATNFGVNLSYPTSSTALLYAIYSTSTSSTASATGLQMGLNSTTAFTVSASPTSGTFLRINLKGIIKTSTTAGNFSPTFTLTNGATSTPTATLTIAANSFIKVNPIAGVGADINIGGWA
jgi:hypothetical protein